MHSKDYGRDVLAGDWRKAHRRAVPEVQVERGLVVEEAGEGFCGAVVDGSKETMVLEDRHGRRRHFPWGHGYLLEGELHDLTLGKTFRAGEFAMRRPGMPHGPYRTETGCVMLETRYR